VETKKTASAPRSRKAGNGKVRINIDTVKSIAQDIAKAKIMEPLLQAGT
jgi:ribosomal protein S9